MSMTGSKGGSKALWTVGVSTRSARTTLAFDGCGQSLVHAATHHTVAATDALTDDRLRKEDGAAEDEDVHRANQASPQKPQGLTEWSATGLRESVAAWEPATDPQ
jgi:hypothetical protein